jgi:anti-sigma B factor antagonist
MKVRIRNTNEVVIFDLHGKIIGNDGIIVQKNVTDLLATSVAPKLLFNLADVSKMDSAGLGVLVQAHACAKEKGGRVGVIHVGKNIRSLLVKARLIMVLEYFDSEANAIASLSSA